MFTAIRPPSKKLQWRPKLDVAVRTDSEGVLGDAFKRLLYFSSHLCQHLVLNAYNLGISGYRGKTFLGDLKIIFNIASVYLGVHSPRVF